MAGPQASVMERVELETEIVVVLVSIVYVTELERRVRQGSRLS